VAAAAHLHVADNFEALGRRGCADADVGAGACTVYPVDAAEDERVILCDEGAVADGGGVRERPRAVAVRAEERVVAARRVLRAGEAAEGGVRNALRIAAAGIAAEEGVAAARSWPRLR
jgi:hypothetical protein